jgi:hypothetical protein
VRGVRKRVKAHVLEHDSGYVVRVIVVFGLDARGRLRLILDVLGGAGLVGVEGPEGGGTTE